MKDILCLETLFLGCSDNKEIAIPGQSHSIRFCHSTMYSTCTILSQINKVFVNAQQLADEHCLKEPYRVSVFWPEASVKKKRKTLDNETAYFKMKWYFENYIPPKNGLVVSFYLTRKVNSFLDTPFEARYVWPTKKQWQPKGKFIAVHAFEPLIGNPIKREKIKEKYNKYLPLIESYANLKDLEVKYIDYRTPMDEMYETMINCEYLLSYQGASYYFASCTSTPVAGFSHKDLPDKSKEITGKYFDIKTNELVVGTFERTQWGEMRSNAAILPRLDVASNQIMLGPLTNYTTIYNEKDILSFLESNTNVTN